jgi:transposase-like protein
MEAAMEERKDAGHRYTPEQKVRIVKEALTTDIGVSGVCRKYGISSGLFYKWQEKFFEGAVEGFRRGKDGLSSAELRKLESLEKENDRMKSVIAEITAENIDFKKKLGDF